MSKAENIESRNIKSDKVNGFARDGARIIANKIVDKYSLSTGAKNPLYYYIKDNQKAMDYIDETVRVLVKWARSLKMNYEETNYVVIYFFSHHIGPTAEAIKQGIVDWRKKGVNSRELIKSPEVLREDVSNDTIDLLSVLIRKAGLEPTPAELSKYISLGITLDHKTLIKKIGICLATGANASDILKNYLLLNKNISLELLYSAVFEASMQREIVKEHIPGSLPLLEGTVDLKQVYKVIKKEQEEIKEVGTADRKRIGIMDRYMYGPKAAFSATVRTTKYLELDKSK